MKKAKDGFSMIEMMVASTLMIILVIMLGMLFQQMSKAWSTGKQRADMLKEVRTFFGALQRDANAAVDENTIPLAIRSMLGGQQNFSEEPAFYTLTGTGFQDDAMPSEGVPRRAFSFVTYSGGTRSERWIGGETRSGRLIARDFKFNAYKYLNNLKPDPIQSGSEFPAFITVNMGASGKGKNRYDVGAASSGPDRLFGMTSSDLKSRDDIKTWND